MSISYELRARLALEKYGFKNAHSLGQNFIFDEALLGYLLDRAELRADDNVLEIGPGAGLMTALISQNCRSVVSVEIDEKLRPVLEEVLADCQNVSLVFADAMRANIADIVNERFGQNTFRVIANLPYYITTDLLTRLVTLELPITDMCVMVQKEASERLMSHPGEKQWCATAALMDYYGEFEVITDVSRTSFTPQPHVDSVFLRYRVFEEMPVKAKDDGMMRRVINAAFLMRRKKLVNNLKAAFSITAQDAIDALDQAGIDPNVRGETLEICELQKLSDVLSVKRN